MLAVIYCRQKGFFAPSATFSNMLIRGDLMHKLEYDKSKKSLVATLSGNIGVQEANSMLLDFKNAVKELNTEDINLIIYPNNISASLFVLPIVQNFIQLVSQLNFKKIYLINTDKYAEIIKQSLASYGMSDKIYYVRNLREALFN